MSIEAMKQALGALHVHAAPHPMVFRAMDALRLAIEQAQERQWQDLTEDDIWAAIRPLYDGDASAAFGINVSINAYRAIEAKLREKNG